MILYGLKACDTCRAAVKALRDKGAEVEFIDVRDKPVSTDLLTAFLAEFGDALLNKRSTTWRGLSEEERRFPALTLLSTYPTLMKRPVIVEGELRTLGWSAEIQKRWFS